jgi:hypothetical protein
MPQDTWLYQGSWSRLPVAMRGGTTGPLVLALEGHTPEGLARRFLRRGSSLLSS